MQLEGNRALSKQIELIGCFAFTEQVFPGGEAQVSCAARDRRAEFGTEPGKKG